MRLIGWYSSIVAAEPYVVSAVSTYIPLLLDEIARSESVDRNTHSKPCFENCVYKLWFWYLEPTSLPLYTISISVFVQVLFVISFSGVIDRSNKTKLVYISSASLGAVCTALLGVASKYTYAAFLFWLANGCFGIVSVCGNSFIPRMANALNVQRKIRFRTDLDRFHNAFRATELAETDSEFITKVSTRMSSTGAGLGYIAAALVHLTTLVLVWMTSSDSDTEVGGNSMHNYTLPLKFIGGWWLLGQLPVMYLFSVPDHVYTVELEFRQLLKYGWEELSRAVNHARNLQDICIFLLGWFLLSDAVTTINSTAVLFARNNLNMGSKGLAGIGSLSVIFAIFGSVWVGPKLNRLRAMTVISLFGAAIPLYGILGFFMPFIGLKHGFEMYILAAWHGIVLGALNAVARSLYSVLIPRDNEASFFALYSLTDKGSSVIGPLITGLLTDYFHDIRYAFYFLLVVMLLSAYVFTNIDFERGELDAVEYANEVNDA